jgi:hypothetical protein
MFGAADSVARGRSVSCWLAAAAALGVLSGGCQGPARDGDEQNAATATPLSIVGRSEAPAANSVFRAHWPSNPEDIGETQEVFEPNALAAPPLAALPGGSGQRVRDVAASPIFVKDVTLAANRSHTIELTNLAPSSADSVLHVAMPDGSFLSDDDSGAGLASKIVVPSATSARTVTVIVRALLPNAAGAGTLHVIPSVGPEQPTSSVSFSGARVLPTNGSLIAGSHVLTVEQEGGASDTVLLVIGGAATNLIGFNQSSGVGNMSWLHLGKDCSSCAIVVGTKSQTLTRPTTVIWDEDVHVEDCDADGLGDALEVAIGSEPCNDDTDADGLSDSLETIGSTGPNPGRALEFPKWGASPTERDLFMELDWETCDPATTDEPCNADGPDSWRVPASEALEVATFFAPDVKVHLDTGVANEDPITRTTYNDWGGAKRVSLGSSPCAELSSERVGLFHHGLIRTSRGGGGTLMTAMDVGSPCFAAAASSHKIAHEAAHGVGLAHGGPIASPSVNCLPTYRSTLNYAYNDVDSVATFSRRGFAAFPLDPTALDESAGLGPRRPETEFLSQWPFSFKVSESGAVDWNRNGIAGDSGLVRAAPNWGSSSCEQSVLRREALGKSFSPTLVRVSAPVPRIYLFTIEPNGSIDYRRATSTERCAQYGHEPCVAWSPPSSANPLKLLNANYGGSALAAAEYLDAQGKPRLMLVYAGVGSTLRYQIATPDAFGVLGTTAAALVGDGSEPISGDPALIGVDGGLILEAIVGGKLRRWDFTPLVGWSAKSTQEQWDYPGGIVDITAKYGLALTLGYQNDLATEQVYALIPDDSTNEMSFARLERTTRRWHNLDPDRGRDRTGARPGLVYVPFDRAGDPRQGRFYSSYNAVSPEGASSTLRIAMSENNTVTAPPNFPMKRLRWLSSIDFGNQWLKANGPVSLLYDRFQDDNVRAAFVEAHDNFLTFAPLADGIVKAQLRDNDDYQAIRGGLSCSLTSSCSFHVKAFANLFRQGSVTQLFGPGLHGPAEMGDVRDEQLLSMEIPPAIFVRLCSEPDGSGVCQNYQGMVDDVLPWMRGIVSSIDVRPGVTLYSQPGFAGSSQTFPPGSFDHTTFVTIGNDNVRSIRVAPGVKARLCSESGGWGDCQTFTGHHATIGGTLGHGTSNVEVMPL